MFRWLCIDNIKYHKTTKDTNIPITQKNLEIQNNTKGTPQKSN